MHMKIEAKLYVKKSLQHFKLKSQELLHKNTKIIKIEAPSRNFWIKTPRHQLVHAS